MEIYRDKTESAITRARDLIKRMTKDEKIAQMMGCIISSEDNINDLKKKLKNGIGQVSCISGVMEESIYDFSQNQKQLQEIIIQQNRFGIPAIFHAESLCGINLPDMMSFPCGIGQAATFDPLNQKKIGEVIGKAARAVGVTEVFSPVLDISRDSRFGRQGESYGEDPTLASVMGSAMINGLQHNENYLDGVIATAKHFLGYQAGEGGIHAAECKITERELREIYAKPFQAAISEANLLGIMPCYSSINGQPIACSYFILTQLLREQMGFNGLIVSDYSAVEEIYSRHGVGVSLADAGKKAILAGIQQELPEGKCFLPEVLSQYENEELEKAIDAATLKILEIKFKIGLFEKPFADSKEKIKLIVEDKKIRNLSKKTASESFVLLKNNGILPLKHKTMNVAVIGPHANSVRALFGGYSWMSMFEWLSSNKRYDEKWEGSVVNKDSLETENLARKRLPNCRTFLEALIKEAPEMKFIYQMGYPYTGTDQSFYKEALIAAKNSDFSILTTGEKYGTGSTASMGEGIDGTNINLPACQENFIKEIHKFGKPIIIIHFGGRPISSDAADLYADAILEIWTPGEEGAEALAETLFGKYSPGGKMPLSTAYTSGQIPVYYNHHKGSSYHQGTKSAFSTYVDCPHEPRYFFGYGLSYTSFAYKDLEIRFQKKVENEEQDSVIQYLDVNVKITNTGKYVGSEVVQFYICDPHAEIERPVMELAGFYRVLLKPGETKQVCFDMKISQIAFLDEHMRWKVEKGKIQVMIGSSARDIYLKKDITILEDLYIDEKNRGFYASVKEISL